MIVMYSQPGCGRCEFVKRILVSKEIPYELSDDFEKVINLGLSALPIIEVDGKFYDGTEAINYVKSL